MTPSKQQLKTLIATDNIKGNFVVTLNQQGIFGILPSDDEQVDSSKNIVAYSYGLTAELGYIGLAASNDSHFIDNMYRAFLQEWVHFINNGRTNLVIEEYFTHTEEELIEIIEQKEI
jgi:hypothetical protein